MHSNTESHEVDKPSPSTRYFTLEKALGEQAFAFCEWTSKRQHRTLFLGTGAADLQAFANTVYRHITQPPP